MVSKRVLGWPSVVDLHLVFVEIVEDVALELPSIVGAEVAPGCDELIPLLLEDARVRATECLGERF